MTLRFRIVVGLALLAAFLIAVDLYVARFVDREKSASVKNDLEIRAHILAAQVPPEQSSLDAWVKGAAERTQATITAFDGKGNVLAESGQNASASGEEYFFVDIPVNNSQVAGLRLAGSLGPVHAHAAVLFYRLLAISLVGWALAVVFAYWFLKSLSDRTTRLKDYAEHLLDPTVASQSLPVENDALGALAQSLQRTAARFGKLVGTLELEGARRETILASMLEGVLAVDKHLRVTFCNESFARAIGVRIPLTPGISLLELVRDPALMDILTQALATGARVERRITLLSAGDHSFEVLAGPLAGSRSLERWQFSTMLLSSSVWNECARTLSRMSRTSSAHRWRPFGAMPRHCLTAQSTIARITASFWKS